MNKIILARIKHSGIAVICNLFIKKTPALVDSYMDNYWTTIMLNYIDQFLHINKYMLTKPKHE